MEVTEIQLQEVHDHNDTKDVVKTPAISPKRCMTRFSQKRGIPKYQYLITEGGFSIAPLLLELVFIYFCSTGSTRTVLLSLAGWLLDIYFLGKVM